MIFTEQQIKEACERIAPKYGLDPTLIRALCKQESAHDKNGNYLADIGRPETNYGYKYVFKKYNLATTSEDLLSCSFGVMQCMGDALYDLKFFDFYFNQCDQGIKIILNNPLSEFAIPSAIDHFVENLDWMIDFGCQWFKKKLNQGSGDVFKGLCNWNGDQTGKYANEVLAKQKALM